MEGGRAERGGEGGDGGGGGQGLHDRQGATGDRQQASNNALPDKTKTIGSDSVTVVSGPNRTSLVPNIKLTFFL